MKEEGWCWKLCSKTIKETSELAALLVRVAYLKARKGVQMEQRFGPLPLDEAMPGCGAGDETLGRHHDSQVSFLVHHFPEAISMYVK